VQLANVINPCDKLTRSFRSWSGDSAVYRILTQMRLRQLRVSRRFPSRKRQWAVQRAAGGRSRRSTSSYSAWATPGGHPGSSAQPPDVSRPRQASRLPCARRKILSGLERAISDVCGHRRCARLAGGVARHPNKC